MLRSALVLAAMSVVSATYAQTDLAQGFLNPPNSAKPHTWWHWINGNISKEGITADLEAMKKIGLGGAQIFNVEVGIPEGKVPYMSEPWKDALAHAFKEAKRLGMEICIHNCAGWSSSGGPWVEPRYAMQALTWSETAVHGPQNFSGSLPKPPSRLDYYQDIAVIAIRKPQDDTYRIPNIRQKAAFDRGDRLMPDTFEEKPEASINEHDVRILSGASDGQVTWSVPEGDWILIRMGHTPTGAVNAPAPTAGRGPEVDKLSRQALDAFWSGSMETSLAANGKVEQFGLNNALVDSYEVGSQNWTPEFRSEFKKRRGYDPLPFLPIVTGRVIGDSSISERFLWDMRRTVCDLFDENYFQYFGELCHKNGLKFSTEGYGNGAFDNVRVGGLADIPMGEFWVGGGAMESIKLAASSAHTYGHSVVGAESFTADDNQGRWLVDPYSVKALGDKVMSRGINRFIFHRYTHQPWIGIEPGMTMGPWGMNLERTITWWDQGAAWMREISRSQYMLQQGQFVADIAAYVGDEGPSDLFFSSPPKGYDFDGVDAWNLARAVVKNGRVVLPSGISYRVLVLPETPWMTLATLRHLGTLVDAGAIVVGSKPKGSPSLSEHLLNPDYAKYADAIWGKDTSEKSGSRAFGKGKVYWGADLGNVLKENGSVPDLDCAYRLNWLHRKTSDADIYFVANPSYRPVQTSVTVRSAGRVPEIWNPETGEQGEALAWKQGKDRTTVSMTFQPAGSMFIVLRKKATGNHAEFVTVLGPDNQVAKAPKIEIVSASYEAVDGTGSVDVADKVKQLVAGGETEFSANNSNFGDPTYNHVKQLHIVFRVDGKEQDLTFPENATVTLATAATDTEQLDYELHSDGVYAWRPASMRVQSLGGVKSEKQLPGAISVPLNGTWNLKFDPRSGQAPQPATLTELTPWNKMTDPEAKYFSGSATYRQNLSVSASDLAHKKVFLDLGKVKNFADVTVNGQKFETLWKAPFRVDIARALKPGQNVIQVKVTNLWPNRLIGDEVEGPEANWTGGPIKSWPDWILSGSKMPESKRKAFATWKFYTKDSPLLDSGLIGPVYLRFLDPVKLVSSK